MYTPLRNLIPRGRRETYIFCCILSDPALLFLLLSASRLLMLLCFFVDSKISSNDGHGVIYEDLPAQHFQSGIRLSCGERIVLALCVVSCFHRYTSKGQASPQYT